MVRLAVWTVLGFAVTIAVVAVAAPVALGWRPLAVLSGSMTPTLRTGDEVIVRPVRAESLRIGDVVTFPDPSRDGVLVTHRVRALRIVDGTAHVTTRGDAGSDRSTATPPSV